MSDAARTPGDWQPYRRDDPFAAHVGPLYRLLLDDPAEPIRIGLTIAPQHCNPMGFCHGGMLATLLDLGLGGVGIAAAGATNLSPTIQMSLDFLQAARLGDWIESRARLVHATPRMLFTEGTLVGPDGPLVRGSAIFRRGAPAA